MWRLERLRGTGRASRDAKVESIDSKKMGDPPDEIKEQIRTQCRRILEVLGAD